MSNRGFLLLYTFHYGHTDVIWVEILHCSDYRVKSPVLFSALKAQSEVCPPQLGQRLLRMVLLDLCVWNPVEQITVDSFPLGALWAFSPQSLLVNTESDLCFISLFITSQHLVVKSLGVVLLWMQELRLDCSSFIIFSAVADTIGGFWCY